MGVVISSRLGARLSAAVALAALPLAVVSVHALGTAPSPVASSAGPELELTAATVVAGLHPQPTAPQVTISGPLELRTAAERRARISLASAKGRHTWTASALAEHDLPAAAMRAYRSAATRIDASEPGCHLPWTLLAGIGRVESDHGRYGGSVLGSDGVSRPAIVGVALNGAGPVAAIRDSDGGRFDGDPVWDRAVGPMQFIPSTWRSVGMDGDGDGVASPNDIDDASLAAASYLCRGGRDLSRPDQQRAAIFGYNPSDYYVDLVSAFASGYQTGTFVIPSPAVASGDEAAADARAQHAARPTPATTATPHPAPTAPTAPAAGPTPAAGPRPHHGPAQHPSPTPHPATSPAPKPASPPAPTTTPASHPAPTPTPTPASAPAAPGPASVPGPASPTPSPVPVVAQGPVLLVPGGWSIGTVTLTPADLVPLTPADWDGDGVQEPADQELAGLVASGTVVTMAYLGGPPLVLVSLTVG